MPCTPSFLHSGRGATDRKQSPLLLAGALHGLCVCVCVCEREREREREGERERQSVVCPLNKLKKNTFPNSLVKTKIRLCLWNPRLQFQIGSFEQMVIKDQRYLFFLFKCVQQVNHSRRAEVISKGKFKTISSRVSGSLPKQSKYRRHCQHDDNMLHALHNITERIYHIFTRL